MTAKRFAGRVAVVTGGANGIGFAAAERFAAEGASIVLADLDAATVGHAATSLAERHSVPTLGLRHDVRSNADTEELLSASTELGPIGILMLNAGVSAGGRLEHVPITEWQRLFEINVISVARGLNAFLPTLISQNAPAHVVITGSSASFFGSETGMDAPYAATKSALLGLSRTYRSYLAPSGVSVQMLAPRMTDTAFPRNAVAWGKRGPQSMADRDIGPSDTVDQVADALLAHLGGELPVIALDPETPDKLISWAEQLRM
jgi:NAD(P)-dependent dehydrogenase (short-subunit alcohol dehydrogenase family)